MFFLKKLLLKQLKIAKIKDGLQKLSIDLLIEKENLSLVSPSLNIKEKRCSTLYLYYLVSPLAQEYIIPISSISTGQRGQEDIVSDG